MSGPHPDLMFASQAEHRQWLAQHAALPAGFRAGTTAFEFTPEEVLKPARMSLTLIALDEPTPDFAAVFTRNAFPGAPVLIGRQRLDAPRLGAILVNNKISNVCAPDGVRIAERLCARAAESLGMAQTDILPSSTGIIGWRLPLDAMLQHLPAAVSALQPDSVLPAAEAIMTTDLYPKVRDVRIGDGRVVGIAKGAGMIEPNLATMLVYILTDIAVPRSELRSMLSEAAQTTFNAISIDSDQSTSDTVVALSSGRIAGVDGAAFAEGLYAVCAALAEDIVRNGEGVKHVVKVTVQGAPNAAVAKGTAKAVINSPLMQCAICGNDANVGRLVCAAGKYLGNEHPDVDVSACRMQIGGVTVFEDGAFHLDPDTELQLTAHLEAAELYQTQPPDANGVFRPPVSWPVHHRCVDIWIDLGLGAAAFTAIGGDRTHEYISENADYRS